jgi:hypothetical protein
MEFFFLSLFISLISFTVNVADTLGGHINSLLCDAEKRVHELGGAEESQPQGVYNTRASFSSIICEYSLLTSYHISLPYI